MNTPHPDNLPRTQLPDDLIAEVLSWLPVKSLTRFRCVCKSWNTLIISDHSFIKLHLHKSPLCSNPHLLLQWEHLLYNSRKFCVTQFSGSGLVENPCISLAHDPRYQVKETDCYRVVGSCNGLICLHGYSPFRRRWLCFWNPATKLMSEKLGSFCPKSRTDFKLNFGYDNSTHTYKVVFFEKIHLASYVRVFTLGCNIWRDIQKFPMLPFNYNKWGSNDGVHLCGTINWMASRDEFTPSYYYGQTIEKLVILSLDLGTEKYTLLLPPKGLVELPCIEPSVRVLMDSLCFSHDLKKTHFVIWQMKEFGDADSWIQLLKISYQDLDWVPVDEYYFRYQLFPLCLYNGDTLVLASSKDDQAILYDKRANTVQRTTFTTKSKNILWVTAIDYVESLVSPLSVRSSTTVARLNLC